LTKISIRIHFFDHLYPIIRKHCYHHSHQHIHLKSISISIPPTLIFQYLSSGNIANPCFTF